MNSKKKTIYTLFIFILICTPVLGQIELYSTINVGLGYHPSLKMKGASNDRASYCDEYINPNYQMIPGCDDMNRGVGDYYTVDFESSFGRSGSLGLGLQITSSIAFELEHHFSVASYNETSEVNGFESRGVDREKLEGEIYKAEERLGDLKSSSFSGNVIFKLARLSSWSPYLGLGVGISSLQAEYASVWARFHDAERINTAVINQLENADQIKQNLAGAVSSAFGPMKDTVISYKILGGLEYHLSQKTSVMLKINYTNYGKLKSQELVWDPLRSHPPNIRLDDSEPIQSYTEIDNIYSLSLDFGVKINL
ncbi:MAG: hypothetical protein OXE77_11135 [Flavobacteriaceae bacterium]|nr:hypothetical protein [Flavobacteriaceae bacterium]MCY4268372.1 hypothetical protein [Flavobacteriaceae bacterium]MCY4298390.1 hypothetical protein [Flavobacteriaceae bacterium]